MVKRLIAKVKFWFGKDLPIFDKKMIVEFNGDFAYVYEQVKIVR